MKWLVYAKCSRDAQIYSGNPDVDDIYEEINENKWIDFFGDELLDIVDAGSYDDAVKAVAEGESDDMDENALYAIEADDNLNKVTRALIKEYKECVENLYSSDKSESKDYSRGYKAALNNVIKDLTGILNG